MLAAYDNAALYFFFLVKENSLYDLRTACTSGEVWKANAAEVFIDYSTWSPSLYQAYFSADAGGLIYGTSTKTLQLDKPAFPQETRKYYRDRSLNNRFEVRTPGPAGLEAVAASPTAADSLTIGVEMKIPFPGGSQSAFAAGNSIFISWGYNHYPDSAKADCTANPIAYRWAKHFKSYDSGQKPPGWRADDSTHFDPVRSWDGWGRFYLDPLQANTATCRTMEANTWDLAYWKTYCGSATSARALVKKQMTPENRTRDSRGRLAKPTPGQILFPTPWKIPAGK